MFCAFCTSEAQTFRDCEIIFNRLLPVFNQAKEENNPSLLNSPEYRKDLIALQKAYQQYHRLFYDTKDSIQRVNNEAVILSLSGNYSKGRRIISSILIGPEGAPPQYYYNQAMVYMLNKEYNQARQLFQSDLAYKSAALNTMVTYAEEGNYAGAMGLAEQGGGSDGKFSFNRGLLHKLTKNYEAAYDDFSAAIKSKDKFMAYRIQRGDVLMKMANEKKAVDDFEKVAKLGPKAQIRYANALVSLNQFDKALAILKDYLAGKDRTYRGDAYLGIAHAYYGKSNFVEAQRYYRLARAGRLDDRAAVCGEANVMVSTHNYEGAIRLFNQVIEMDKDYLSAYLGRAVALYGKKDYTGALADFKIAESLITDTKPYLADLFVSRGFSYYYTGKKDLAAKDFETAIAMDPKRFEALGGMSSIMIEQKRYPEAGQYLSKALSYEKGNDRMYANYGNLLFHFNMFKKSYDVFRRAVAINKRNLKAQNGWALALLENDQLDRSKKLLDSLVKANPDIPYLLNNRGIAYAYVGNRHEQRKESELAEAHYKSAFNDFNKALELKPVNRFYNVNVGNVYRYWEEYDEAQLSYKAYQDKSALNNMGVMFAGQERMKDAMYYMGVALQVDSTHRVVKYNMAVLANNKQKELARLVASTKEGDLFSDIGIKYSLDGFVTLYLYDYEFDPLEFKGRHFLELPVEEYSDNYFIPHYDFELLEYTNNKLGIPIKKKPRYKSQKVKLPGKKGSGTDCPVF